MRCIKRVGDVYLARAVCEVGVKMPTYLHLMRSHNMGRTSRMALGVLIACVAVFGLSIMAPQSAMAASSNLKANQVQGMCTKAGTTMVAPTSAATLTCAPFTNLGQYKGSSIQYRWSSLYADKNIVHTLVSNSLVAYNRTFSSKAEQQMYEGMITSDLEFDAFISLLVTMSKKSFPGFADLITKERSVHDVVTPWATQLANARFLPTESFNQVGEGFLLALGTGSTPASQVLFDALLAKSETLRAYADAVDHNYWVNFSNPSLAQITQRFTFIDSLLTLSESEAQAAYLAKIKLNAKNIYSSFASAIDSGQTVDQLMAPWVAHFVDQLELYRGSINPIQERTLIQVAMTPPTSMSAFDLIISKDVRWATTTKAKAAANSKASF